MIYECKYDRVLKYTHITIKSVVNIYMKDLYERCVILNIENLYTNNITFK